MRRIEERPSGPEFDAWCKRRNSARERLLDAWLEARSKASQEGVFKPSFNEDLYKDFRQVFLFKAFYQKCAYCEVNHSDGSPVQVEHYRPKGAVTENREYIKHTGYFWLAYEWWNLLPSCAHCNTKHTDPSGQSHPGKLNEFPVSGERILAPCDDPDHWQDELVGEGAVLVNPYFDDPVKHIGFDPATGAAIAKSPRGKATIDICDLNRPALRDKRLALRNDALLAMVSKLLDKRSIDEVVPPSNELTLWRAYLVDSAADELKEEVQKKINP